MTPPSAVSPSGRPPKSARVLLLATERWLSTARLALSLHSVGCDVQLMALRGHPAMLIGAVSARYAYHPLNPLASVRTAIEQAKPDTVIPVDELALMHLIEFHGPALGAAPQELARRSLGGEMLLSLGNSRMTLLELAKSEGIGVPETLAVNSVDALRAAAVQLGFPLVLKADSTTGGRGVRIANNLEEARAWWRRLYRPLSLPRSIWRWLRLNEWTHFRPWFKRRMRGVTAQKFLSGTERTAMAVAHQGELRACVCFEVAQTSKHLGPSTVLRVVEDPVMVTAMRAVLRRTGTTGFCGFDFMLSDSGVPLLIEMNSRPTQLAHLALGPGRDLVAAYVREVLGRDVADRASATDRDLIALYPQELVRDPQSSVLAAAHHDVPWESPALVRYALDPLPEVIVKDPRWKG